MKLTILGSSSAIFNEEAEYRFPAAHLIEVPHSRILLDASIAVLPQLNALDLSVEDIQTICISHFHADHCNLQPIMQAYFLKGKFSDAQQKPSLRICGPSGIKERVISGFNYGGFSYDNDFLPNVHISYTEYEDGASFVLDNGVSVTPHKTVHYGLDAYTLRLEYEQKTLCYSGDTARSEGLLRAAQNVDLFLCEASNRVGQASDEGHLNPEEVALIGKEVYAKRIVMTHYSGFDSEIKMLENAQETDFPGEITVARDLGAYEI